MWVCDFRYVRERKYKDILERYLLNVSDIIFNI